jgi:hypothetical protein
LSATSVQKPATESIQSLAAFGRLPVDNSVQFLTVAQQLDALSPVAVQQAVLPTQPSLPIQQQQLPIQQQQQLPQIPVAPVVQQQSPIQQQQQPQFPTQQQLPQTPVLPVIQQKSPLDSSNQFLTVGQQLDANSQSSNVPQQSFPSLPIQQQQQPTQSSQTNVRVAQQQVLPEQPVQPIQSIGLQQQPAVSHTVQTVVQQPQPTIVQPVVQQQQQQQQQSSNTIVQPSPAVQTTIDPALLGECPHIQITNSLISLANGEYTKIAKDLYKRTDNPSLPGFIIAFDSNWCITYAFRFEDAVARSALTLRQNCGSDLDCCMIIGVDQQSSLGIQSRTRQWTVNNLQNKGKVDGSLLVTCVNGNIIQQIQQQIGVPRQIKQIQQQFIPQQQRQSPRPLQLPRLLSLINRPDKSNSVTDEPFIVKQCDVRAYSRFNFLLTSFLILFFIFRWSPATMTWFALRLVIAKPATQCASRSTRSPSNSAEHLLAWYISF